jgi:hypothetical protein
MKVGIKILLLSFIALVISGCMSVNTIAEKTVEMAQVKLDYKDIRDQWSQTKQSVRLDKVTDPNDKMALMKGAKLVDGALNSIQSVRSGDRVTAILVAADIQRLSRSFNNAATLFDIVYKKHKETLPLVRRQRYEATISALRRIGKFDVPTSTNLSESIRSVAEIITALKILRN